MADLSVTAASVQLMSSANTQRVQAGEAGITQGMSVYMDTADSDKWKKCINTSAAAALAGGIALTPAGDDEYFLIVTSGKVDLGATLAVGEVYGVSDTAGKIRPVVDDGTGDFVTILGVATAADALDVQIRASGVVHA